MNTPEREHIRISDPGPFLILEVGDIANLVEAQDVVNVLVN